MFPFLAFAVPTLVEALVVAATTTIVVRVTNDAYDSATEKKEDDEN